MKYWRTAVFATAAVALAAIGITRLAGHASPGSGDPVSASAGTPALIDADADGAIVLQPSGELWGVDAAGHVRWRDRDLSDRLNVGCLARCPDAVGSGSDGPGPAPTIWRLGDARVVDTAPGVVLWATSRDELLAIRPGTTGDVIETRTASGISSTPLDGTDPRLFAAPDRSRAVLVTTAGYRIVDRGAGGWRLSPTRAAPVQSACPGSSGLPIAYYDGDHTAILDTPQAQPRALPVTGVGRCAVGRTALLTQGFRQETHTGQRTTTRLLDGSGNTLWERADSGFHPGAIDPDTGTVALPTDTGLLLLTRDGRATDRLSGIVDARFLPSGCLVLLHADSTVTTRCGH